MRRLVRAAAVLIGVAVLVTTGESAGVFDKAEYAARRSRLMEKIGDGAAVFLGAPVAESGIASWFTFDKKALSILLPVYGFCAAALPV